MNYSDLSKVGWANNYSYDIISIFNMTHTSWIRTTVYIYDAKSKLANFYCDARFTAYYKDIITISVSYTGVSGYARCWLDLTYNKNCRVSIQNSQSNYDIESNLVNKTAGSTEQLFWVQTNSSPSISFYNIYVK